MHPLNPYLSNPPNFKQLASNSDELFPFVFKTSDDSWSINFKSPNAVRALTRALLNQHFGLDISIPDDRLSPTVANRLDYLLWLDSIVRYPSTDPPGPTSLRALDIGTGSTAIYPALACKHFGSAYSFVATEIDPNSFHYAQGNISRNFLSERVRLVKTTKDDPIFLPMLSDPMERFDFTMCNPPFYSSYEEVVSLANNKEFAPHAICTGAETEMITKGGEVGFVKRMVEESVQLRSRCRWFSSLLGKVSSVGEIVASLRSHDVYNYAITALVQGHTKRWAIAWSFEPFFLPVSIAQPPPTSSFNKSLSPFLPHPNTLSITFPSSRVSCATLSLELRDFFRSLDGVSCERMPAVGGEGGEGERYLVTTSWHSWTRAARRGKGGPAPGTTKGLYLSTVIEIYPTPLPHRAPPSPSPLPTLHPSDSTQPNPPPSSAAPLAIPSTTLTFHLLRLGDYSAQERDATRISEEPKRRLTWEGLWNAAVRRLGDEVRRVEQNSTEGGEDKLMSLD